MSKRETQEQVWVDKQFKEFIKDIMRRKTVIEKPQHDFSFGDITADIFRCTELRNGIEERMLKNRGKKDEAKLF